MSNQKQRDEDCRHQARRYLAERSALSFSAATIRRQVNREFDFCEAEIAEALQFLDSLGELKVEPDPLGSTRYYQITAKGKLVHERSDR